MASEGKKLCRGYCTQPSLAPSCVQYQKTSNSDYTVSLVSLWGVGFKKKLKMCQVWACGVLNEWQTALLAHTTANPDIQCQAVCTGFV